MGLFMQVNALWIIFALVIVIVGTVIVVRGLRQNRNLVRTLNETQYKHGLPILPRDEREFAPLLTQPSDDAPQVAPEFDAAEPVDASQPEPQPAAFSIAEDEAVECTDESPVIDRHLIEQQYAEEEDNPLQDYESTFTVVITPQFGTPITGRQVLQIAQEYGLKHGTMNMFHRHENEDGRGVRWFSMMAEGKEGPTVFDLNTLLDAQFSSLILFLVTPHKQPLRGYDSMVSTANLLAQSLHANLTDENRNLLDDEYFVRCRAFFANQ